MRFKNVPPCCVGDIVLDVFARMNRELRVTSVRANVRGDNVRWYFKACKVSDSEYECEYRWLDTHNSVIERAENRSCAGVQVTVEGRQNAPVMTVAEMETLRAAYRPHAMSMSSVLTEYTPSERHPTWIWIDETHDITDMPDTLLGRPVRLENGLTPSENRALAEDDERRREEERRRVWLTPQSLYGIGLNQADMLRSWIRAYPS